MTLGWKQFKIDLDSFNSFLKLNCSNCDGIVTNENDFTIVEKQALTQNEIDSINQYYENLTEEGELSKLQRTSILITAIMNCKETLLSKSYVEMTTLEKKLMLSIPLTTQEEDELISIHG